MKKPMRILQGLKLVAVVALALSMGACANKNIGADAMASAATPGSQQDFVVNVGDRVFFESDQTDLSPQAVATLDKQIQWLQTYPLHDRGARGRTRHPRIQHRARRPPRPVGAHLHVGARHRSQPHAHDLLRQGTAGRGLQRHLLLVAEPSCRHGAEREFVGTAKSLRTPAPLGRRFHFGPGFIRR
jgi:peptidoglycan-associated lipoprotein